MIKSKAEYILGLREPYTLSELKTRFADRIKTAHPDTQEDDLGQSVTDLKTARDTLLPIKKEEEAYETCGYCQGSGKRPNVGSFDLRTCSSCDGQGRIRK